MGKKESDSGNLAEKIFLNFFNNKKYSELEDCNLKSFLNFICRSNTINEDEHIIYCWDYIKKSNLTKGNAKVDVELKINNRIFYISIKSGANNSLHEEPKETFLEFLKNFSVSSSDLNLIERHMSEYIKIRNTSVDRFFKNNKKKIIKRVLEGRFKQETIPDYYFACKSIADLSYKSAQKILQKGVFASKKQTEEFMNSNNPDTKGKGSMTCDVGVLTYQAVGRKKHPKPQFKWSKPYEDLKKIYEQQKSY